MTLPDFISIAAITFTVGFIAGLGYELAKVLLEDFRAATRHRRELKYFRPLRDTLAEQPKRQNVRRVK